jgi:hypothetical protein
MRPGKEADAVAANLESHLGVEAALHNKIRKLEKENKALKEKASASIPRLSYAALTTGTLRGVCRNYAVVPPSGLMALVEGMQSANLDKCWKEILVNDRRIVKETALPDAVAMACTYVKLGVSAHVVGHLYGLKRDNDIEQHTYVKRFGEIIRYVVVLCNLWMSDTVALPPDLAQIDANTLRDFRDESLANVIGVADATNVAHKKPHAPEADKHSYSDYYNANCGKIEVGDACVFACMFACLHVATLFSHLNPLPLPDLQQLTTALTTLHLLFCYYFWG